MKHRSKRPLLLKFSPWIRVLCGGEALQILLVEGDRAFAAGMSTYLQAKGYRVDVATDGIGGMYLALEKEYDVIVLDESLPGKGGIALCRELREDKSRRTPILMLAACETLDGHIAALEAGANGFMPKTAPPRAVGERLKTMFYRANLELLGACGTVA
jgi:DNA-binding response OmpR family regulator